MDRYLLAHDLGTSGNKATLYSEQGKLLRSTVYSYDTVYGKGNRAEQNADDWWKAICESTKELLQGLDSSLVASVSFSGQMMGCLCVDKEGRPLRSSIIWADQRAVAQTGRITEKIDPQRFYRITGHRPSPSYTIAKLLWIKENQPEIYRDTYKVLNAKDYIVFQLTGKFYTDYTDGSGTNMMDLTKLCWSKEIIHAMEIEENKLPELRESTFVAGGVTAQAATATGLKEGTPVVLGGGDGACAAVGAGCIGEGTAYNVLGSSSWIGISTREPIFDEEMRTFTFAHIVPGYYQPMGTMQTAGLSYNWLKNEICTEEVLRAKELGLSPYRLIDEQVANSPAGAKGLLFLPYLLGERSPRWNPNARGAFIGLTMEHKREDMLRSVLEGVALNLNVTLQAFQKYCTIDEMVLIGGGAKGEVWQQILCDVFGVKIARPVYLEEATSMGAAITGGVGAGVFKSFDVVYSFNATQSTKLPSPKNHELYKQLMPIFNHCYDGLVGVFDQLAALK